LTGLPAPARGVAHGEAPGIRRIVARNAGPMTYHGTNTWLIDTARGAVVVDPGPDDEQHLADILAATDGRVAGILLTHAHRDHAGGLAALRSAAGAPVHDRAGLLAGPLRDLPGWTALATPGHAADHLCFARDDGIVLTGDLVLGWTTGLVDDMAACMASLQMLLTRADHLYLPGHGPALTQPARLVRALLHHRLAREGAVLGSLSDGPRDFDWLLARHYPGLDPALRGAATINLRAHLHKLANEGRVRRTGDDWQATSPAAPPAP
jgi:glyoxylase-like metal-dependent hydrolase (beta-lactamase superfamily II)